MSTTKFRIVETGFEREARRPGGKKVSAAVLEAYSNLATLAAKTLPRFHEGLQTIRGIAGNGADRPSDEALREMYTIADRLIGYCLTVNLPGLDQVLLRTARLSDAVRQSDLWIPGTFAPLIETYQLVLEGSLELAQVCTLIENIDLCIDRYQRSERAGVPA